MHEIKNDYKARKILNAIFFVSIFIVFISAIVLLWLQNYTAFINLRKIIEVVFYVFLGLTVLIFIFCVIEIIINNLMNKKVITFLNEKQYSEGIEYIEKLPALKIFYNMYIRKFYYKGLLYLHLDDIKKAESSFFMINLDSGYIEEDVFLNSILYLLLIVEESGDEKRKEIIKKYFCDNIISIKNNKYKYQKYVVTINIIENIIENGSKNIVNYLQSKKEIPLIARLLLNNECYLYKN